MSWYVVFWYVMSCDVLFCSLVSCYMVCSSLVCCVLMFSFFRPHSLYFSSSLTLALYTPSAHTPTRTHHSLSTTSPASTPASPLHCAKSSASQQFCPSNMPNR